MKTYNGEISLKGKLITKQKFKIFLPGLIATFFLAFDGGNVSEAIECCRGIICNIKAMQCSFLQKYCERPPLSAGSSYTHSSSAEAAHTQQGWGRGGADNTQEREEGGGRPRPPEQPQKHQQRSDPAAHSRREREREKGDERGLQYV